MLMAKTPLLLALPISLKTKCKLHLDNSSTLATAVSTKTTKKAAGAIIPKTLGPIAPLSTGDHDVRPIELLHAIGRSLTPPTAALAGLSAWWAVLRWLWAFDSSGPRLKISPDAKALSFHNRQAFSEALGIAASRIFAERAYRSLHGSDVRFRFVDADAAIAAGALTDSKLAGAVLRRQDCWSPPGLHRVPPDGRRSDGR
jgi:hypothetical protein